MSECRLCHVSGRVQGVFFRDTARQQACRLNLTGHAINLPDGRVEVLACGEARDVQALCDWLWQGPAHARVEEVRCAKAAVPPPAGFRIG
ncbi:MAG TPA: acylphosphatase [Chromatiales bacterium]|nr:acylphosphatase [Chromatiales bacterium]